MFLPILLEHGIIHIAHKGGQVLRDEGAYDDEQPEESEEEIDDL